MRRPADNPCFIVQEPEDLQGMDDTRNVTQYCQEDVDQEVGIATALEEDTERRKDDGENDLADVATVRATLVMILVYSSTEIQIKAEEGRCGKERNAYRHCRGCESSRLTLQ